MYQLSHTVEPKKPLTDVDLELGGDLRRLDDVLGAELDHLLLVGGARPLVERRVAERQHHLREEVVRERGDLDAVAREHRLDVLGVLRIDRRAVGVEVVRAAPGRELEGLVAEVGGVLRDLLQRLVVEENREQSHLHGALTSRIVVVSVIPAPPRYSSASSAGPIGRGLVAMLRLCHRVLDQLRDVHLRRVEPPGAQRRRQVAVAAGARARPRRRARRPRPSREPGDVLAERLGDLAELRLAGRAQMRSSPGGRKIALATPCGHAVARGHGRRGGVHDRVRVHVERDARHAARERDLRDGGRLALVHGAGAGSGRSSGSRGC